MGLCPLGTRARGLSGRVPLCTPRKYRKLQFAHGLSSLHGLGRPLRRKPCNVPLSRNATFFQTRSISMARASTARFHAFPVMIGSVSCTFPLRIIRIAWHTGRIALLYPTKCASLCRWLNCMHAIEHGCCCPSRIAIAHALMNHALHYAMNHTSMNHAMNHAVTRDEPRDEPRRDEPRTAPRDEPQREAMRFLLHRVIIRSPQ